MSNKNNNTIEINGKRYDAVTGEAYSGHEPESQPEPSAPKKSDEQSIARHVARHSARHEPLTSKILMRKAVKKPGPSLKRQVKAQGQLGLEKRTPVDLIGRHKTPELSLQRSGLLPQSQSISHFTPGTALTPSTGFTATASKPATPISNNHSSAGAWSARELKRPETTSEFLERAIRQASAHEQKPLRKPRHSHIRRRPNVIAGAVLAVTLISVVAAHSLTGAQLQQASAKAGFSAKLPDYTPAGFSKGQLNYSAGVVNTEFDSNSDSRNYTITQKASSLDNTSLLESFVEPNNANYGTIEKDGRTIYVYGNHDATWINSGIWYIVQTDGSLSDQQLAELAASL